MERRDTEVLPLSDTLLVARCSSYSHCVVKMDLQVVSLSDKRGLSPHAR